MTPWLDTSDDVKLERLREELRRVRAELAALRHTVDYVGVRVGTHTGSPVTYQGGFARPADEDVLA